MSEPLQNLQPMTFMDFAVELTKLMVEDKWEYVPAIGDLDWHWKLYGYIVWLRGRKNEH